MTRLTWALVGAIAICSAALPFPAAAMPSEVPGGPVPVSQRGPGLDDYSTHPAYQAFYSQKLTWSTANCIPLEGAPGESTQRHEDKPAPPAQPAKPVTECARVLAPKDWHNPAAGTLTVAIGRPQAAEGAPRPARLLFGNPGGPGGPGIDFTVNVALGLKLTDTHMAVGIDPRGTGRGSLLHCERATQPPAGVPADASPTTWTTAQVRTFVQHTTAELDACYHSKDSLWPYITTPHTARDFNLVRHLLGYDTADYFGVSYGTWLGATLAKMFPRNFDRVVLDANTNWQNDSFRTTFGGRQPEAFQLSAEQVVIPWIARHDATYHLGATPAAVRATFADMQAKLAQRPFRGEVSTMTFDLLLLAAARTPLSTLEESVKGLAELKATLDAPAPEKPAPSDPAPEAPAPTMDSWFQNVFDAIKCNDNGSWGSIDDETARVQQAMKHPLQGFVQAEITCANWPRPAAITDELRQRPLHGVLMTHTENDAATAYAGALDSAHTAPGQAHLLLVDDGHGHGAVAHQCARAAEVAYLTQGTYPQGHASCQASPLPGERTVYEFGQNATAQRPLTTPVAYDPTDVSMPPVDEAATAAWQAANPEGRREEQRNPALDAALREVREYSSLTQVVRRATR